MPTQPSSANRIVTDACAVFESYLSVTSGSAVRRLNPQDADGNYLYPEATVQVDSLAFAGVFNFLWGALKDQRTFEYFYSTKPRAFQELKRIVTPSHPDPRGLTACARFWVLDHVSQVTAASETQRFCRTLRNGFAHFNFRYMNESPRGYFDHMGLSLPNHIPDPDSARNYRIFICDWRPRTIFMSPDSDTRIVETHFAHLRYHLFTFLAYFFVEQGIHRYTDILTGAPIS